MPRAPHAQSSGNDPHPDTSAGQTGSYNTAHGYLALSSLTSGYFNTAHGAYALYSNSSGYYNTALGAFALEDSNGFTDTAIGYLALNSNTTGQENTSTGAYAMESNTTGSNNTASGIAALESNTTGSDNTAIGAEALQGNNSGNYNTAIGPHTLPSNNGSNNIAIGYNAAYNVGGELFGIASNSIHIGTEGASGDNGIIRIGGNTALGDPATQTAFYASGIGNATVSGVPVLVNTSTGQLGVASSSRRFKEDIEDMGEASRDLMRLRPVTFRYKKAFDDGSKPVQYGLIAEEVAEVYPDLVAHSADGQMETVKYQVLDSMLLNEMQKQNQRAEQQDGTIRRQQDQIRSLEARLAALEGLLAAKGATGTAGR
jgi:hypothetical protein